MSGLTGLVKAMRRKVLFFFQAFSSDFFPPFLPGFAARGKPGSRSRLGGSKSVVDHAEAAEGEEEAASSPGCDRTARPRHRALHLGLDLNLGPAPSADWPAPPDPAVSRVLIGRLCLTPLYRETRLAAAGPRVARRWLCTRNLPAGPLTMGGASGPALGPS